MLYMAYYFTTKLREKIGGNIMKARRKISGVELADRMKKGITTKFLEEAKKLEKSRSNI